MHSEVRIAAIGLAIAAAAIASCSAQKNPPGPAPRSHVVTIFSHARHGAARMARVAGSDPDAQCRFCHAEEPGGMRLKGPAEETCYACHARADRAAPSAEACGLCHIAAFGADRFVAATELRPEAPHDARFWHESHREERCANCHAVAATPAARENPGRTAPGLCAACHGAIRFSHEVHVVGARIDCEACHAPEPARGRARPCEKCGREVSPRFAACPRCGEKLSPALPEKPGIGRLMPAHKECYRCHPGVVSETPNKDCALCHDAVRCDFSGPRAIPRLVRGDLIGFSHADHEKASCTTCHAGEPTRREGVAPAPPTMEGCRACHSGSASFDGKPVPSTCATCHAVLRGPIAPADHGTLERPIDHGPAFRRHHDEAARDPANKCLECHDLERSCKSCHAIEPPASHTLRWKKSEHGNRMAQDRSSCTICHQANFCSDCHSLERPPDHRYIPQWKNGGHRLAARRETKRCFVCHSFQPDCSACHP
jgi:hypothetical protein